MKTYVLVGVLLATLSSCSGSPAPQDGGAPLTGKQLSASDCQPLVFPSSPSAGEDLNEAQTITAAALDLFIDASEKDASACASSMGLDVRVVSRDGEEYVVTMDYSPTRVNFSVERGIVTAATVG